MPKQSISEKPKALKKNTHKKSKKSTIDPSIQEDINEQAVQQEKSPILKKKIRKVKKQEVEEQKPIKKSKTSERFNKLRGIDQISEEQKENRGIIYVGHLPYGCKEEELKKYFSQYGKVTRIRLPFSKKTARSKGYGFIEFNTKEVAEIAAESMNEYILFGKKLDVKFLDSNQVHPLLFKNWDKKPKFVNHQKLYVEHKNQKATKEEKVEKVKRLLKKEKEHRMKLKEFGMNYKYPGYTAIVDDYLENQKVEV